MINRCLKKAVVVFSAFKAAEAYAELVAVKIYRIGDSFLLLHNKKYECVYEHCGLTVSTSKGRRRGR